ncbi:MAG TPA: hypothetical protein VE287_05220 [Actinopolymorphaceae bacterium]|nr:hypothetical protein [Actinopolymorphaceae bacterium]
MVAGVVVAAILTAATGTVGTLLGGTTGLLIGLAVGLVLGVVLGWAVTTSDSYDLRSRAGMVEFVLDLTWSLPNTFLGALYLALNLVFGNRLERTYARHTGSVQLAHGVFPRLNGVTYLTTVGTVVAGVDPAVHHHEYGHILQARIFGPCYVPLVLANYVIATVVPFWWLYHNHTRYPIRKIADYFMAGVYPHIWNEEWCYRVYGPPR